MRQRNLVPPPKSLKLKENAHKLVKIAKTKQIYSRLSIQSLFPLSISGSSFEFLKGQPKRRYSILVGSLWTNHSGLCLMYF